MTVLDRLLALLNNGRSYTPEEAADAIDTTPEMIRAMLDQLEHLGYVKGCKPGGTTCSSCPFAGTCQSGRIWSSQAKAAD